MAEITWTKTALEDLKGIIKYIEKDSPNFARIFSERLLNAVNRLELFPESGRVIPEFNVPFIREIIYQSYRVFYLYENEQVKTMTIVHSKQDV